MINCDYQNFVNSVVTDLKKKEILESIYDTEIFKELEQKLKPAGTMSAREKEEIATLLATPTALPQDFDGTLEAWLLRISIWGRISIKRTDPEEKVRNRTMQNREFLHYVDNQPRNNIRGTWDVEELDINKIRFHRTFWSLLGKNVTEEIIVTINLRTDLKRAIKKMRRNLRWF